MAIKLECDRCLTQEVLKLPLLHDDIKEKAKNNTIFSFYRQDPEEFWLCNPCKKAVIRDIRDYVKGASSDAVGTHNQD